MAMTAFHKPHLLILDEPTNDLDVDSREVLDDALNDYEGAVILISHDRHLIDASVHRLWIVRDQTARVYDNDIDSYRRELLGELFVAHVRGLGQRRPRRLALADGRAPATC